MLCDLRNRLLDFAHFLQGQLFPVLQQETGELSELAKRLTAVLALIPLRRYIPVAQGWNGRPSKDRLCIARAFVAKAVYNMPTTRDLLERLRTDLQLRRICGWESATELPHESTFSRAFAEFALMQFTQLVHEALIRDTQSTRLVGHIGRDSTAIEARERFAEAAKAKPPKPKGKKKKRGPRPKGAPRPEPTRLQRQRRMTLAQMLADLPPAVCSIGVKTNSKGHQQYWRGYKLHLDVADGQIPITAMLSGASVHDSQLAIPMATITAQRVTSLYDLMDAAYDANEIRAHSIELGHRPIIDPAAKGRPSKSILTNKLPRQFSWAEEERYKERTMSERVNARLKDEFGARFIRVRGAAKVMTHLMFGVIALTVDQLLRLTG
jgi:Transposase DDE domain/Transposase domain (DUF772)